MILYPTRNALAEALHQTPLDRATRLILADWIEEHEDIEVAVEAAAYQREIANLPKPTVRTFGSIFRDIIVDRVATIPEVARVTLYLETGGWHADVWVPGHGWTLDDLPEKRQEIEEVAVRMCCLALGIEYVP